MTLRWVRPAVLRLRKFLLRLSRIGTKQLKWMFEVWEINSFRDFDTILNVRLVWKFTNDSRTSFSTYLETTSLLVTILTFSQYFNSSLFFLWECQLPIQLLFLTRGKTFDPIISNITIAEYPHLCASEDYPDRSVENVQLFHVSGAYWMIDPAECCAWVSHCG